MIELQGVARSWDGGRRFALRELDLSVERGEFLALIGPSGCGKTTTLRLINRLVEPTAGRVLVAGRDIAQGDPVALRRSIGYVIQGVGLFPHLSVGENVAVVPRLLCWERTRIEVRVAELLDLVGMPAATWGRRRPDQLSGGQRQRVGVARALAGEPGILLMDEPFGALDPPTRDALGAHVRGLQRRLGLTVVFVTHDMSEALLLADRIAVLDAGRLVACDTPAALLAHGGPPRVEELLAAPRRQAARVSELLASAARDGSAR